MEGVLVLLDNVPRLPKIPGSGKLCDTFDAVMIELMRLLADEVLEQGFASTSIIESIGDILRIKLIRNQEAHSESSAPFGPIQINRVTDYIYAQSGRTPSVTELADLFHISRRSLLRHFRATAAMSVSEYITKVQIEAAKAMLADTNLIVKQIAFELGFSSAGNFTLAFKRSVGLTPIAYRTTTRDRSRMG